MKTKRKSQQDKFIETARALGCDESEEAFDAKLKNILTHLPMTQKQVKKKAKRGKNDG